MSNEDRNLTAERVGTIFGDCLFKPGEDTTDHVKAEGIVHPVGFHPGRLDGHREEIGQLLDELPIQFQSQERGGGGGWSFLNACEDKNGNQWADGHLSVEQLFQLGQGIGKVRTCIPREMWRALPGGMPYYAID